MQTLEEDQKIKKVNKKLPFAKRSAFANVVLEVVNCEICLCEKKYFKKNKSKYYQIEGEPFGWIYKLGKDGSLRLMENDAVLIEYTKLD